MARKFTKYPARPITANEGVTELKARPTIYLPLIPGETHEDAVMRMTNMLYDAGFDLLNETLTTDTTELQ